MYRVTTDERSQPQIAALPADALAAFAEARAMLEVAPWGGDPFDDGNPDAPVRTLPFGAIQQGLLTYLVLERERRVDLLAWLS